MRITAFCPHFRYSAFWRRDCHTFPHNKRAHSGRFSTGAEKACSHSARSSGFSAFLAGCSFKRRPFSSPIRAPNFGDLAAPFAGAPRRPASVFGNGAVAASVSPAAASKKPERRESQLVKEPRERRTVLTHIVLNARDPEFRRSNNTNFC